MSAAAVPRLYAGYLPGLSQDEVQWQPRRFAAEGLAGAQALEVMLPVLNAAQTQALLARVRQGAASGLQRMRVADIIAAIDATVALWLNRRSPWRQQAEAWLPLVTGFDAEMVSQGLTGYLQTFRAPELRRFVAQDFANPGVLDGYQPAPKGGAVRAYGPALLLHSWAGNVPALSLWSLVCGLLVKAPSVGKLASSEPLFAGWFAQSLAQTCPALADSLAVLWWQGGGDESDTAQQLYAAADTVMAYGSNDTLAALRQRLPISTRFLPHGHKLGVGLVGRAALDSAKAPHWARQAAWDVMRYDQQGCYSPQVLYVERGAAVTPRRFADYLAAELANLQQRYPRRALNLAEAQNVARWRQSAQWQQHRLLACAQGHWAVAYCDSAECGQPLPPLPPLPPLAPSAQQRSLTVVAVDDLTQVLPLLEAQRPYLQTVGLATTPEQLYPLAEALGQVGITRISALGCMSLPQAGWQHDGRFSLLDLVRMAEIEASAELAAQPLADYAD